MKKTLLSLFALATAAVASAQTITFEAGTLTAGTEATYGTGDFTVVGQAGGDKDITVDENKAKFGVAAADGYDEFTTRWKSGGKTKDVGPYFTVNCPGAGTLKIAARTGSNSATDRTVVVMDGETELYNKVVEEGQKATFTPEGAEGEVGVYPYIEVSVDAKKSLKVSFPIGSINVYGFVFVSASGETPETPVEPDDSPINDIQIEAQVVAVEYFTLAGAKVDEPVKGINIVKTYYSDNTTTTTTLVK